ncbi:MAG: hypothetical protein NT141_01375 [candidate division WWE3 bacterium]|nr:hypothetical protein [candidate division WWE3 bacterium]
MLSFVRKGDGGTCPESNGLVLSRVEGLHLTLGYGKLPLINRQINKLVSSKKILKERKMTVTATTKYLRLVIFLLNDQKNKHAIPASEPIKLALENAEGKFTYIACGTGNSILNLVRNSRGATVFQFGNARAFSDLVRALGLVSDTDRTSYPN